MLIVAEFKTPVGLLTVHHDEQHIIQAHFSSCILKPSSHSTARNSLKTGFCRKIADELACYFSHPLHRFQLPLNPQGTHYQQRVWNELLIIPSGRAWTYGELAHQLKSSPRAIWQACRHNPITLFIPCHRVVGKTILGGYMGETQAPIKKALLQHEGFLPTSISSMLKIKEQM